MASVEPIVGEPAAIADLGVDRALLVADVHAGIEDGLRYERGVELDSRAVERREQLCGLIESTNTDRLVVLGDIAHRIGAPAGVERSELADLIDAITDLVPMTLVEGNHDAGVVDAFGADIDVIGSAGGFLDGTVDDLRAAGGTLSTSDDPGGIAGLHGHTWPATELRDAAVICMGHEHPQVRLADTVGGTRTERVWLRGRLSPAAFERDGSTDPDAVGTADACDTSNAAEESGINGDHETELIVFPAFNERSGGTWVNVPEQSFLSPFLPDGVLDGELYLLDGTRLGDFSRVSCGQD